MTLREFLNTNQNDWASVRIYQSQEDWDSMITDPELIYTDMRQIPSLLLKLRIDAWAVDANFVIHVLI